MRCCVPSCSNTSEDISQSDGVTFHNFPSEEHLRCAWLRALGKQDSHLPDSAVVCSQHFLNDDIYETERGRQIVTGAIPSTVQVCMICLDTDSKMFLMNKHKLEEAYENLTGHPLSDPGNLKQTVCVQCAQRLINFSRFRDKSLRARALMMDLVEKHELITRQQIKMINRTKHQLKSNMVLTTRGPDHCDLHILEHSSEDKQTELEETGHRVVVKTEGSDDSMSVDEDMGVINEDDFVQDPLKYESVSFQCTLCLKEFVHEHAYMEHKCMHLQDGDGDGECDKSQVCKPHTAVSSSSSHSSLITENKQPDPSPAAHAAHALVAPSFARLAADNEFKLQGNEESNVVREIKQVFEMNSSELDGQTSDNNFKSNKNTSGLTNCVVKLYDIFKHPKKWVQNQNESFTKSRKAVSSNDSLNIDKTSKDKIHYSAVTQSEYEAPLTSEVEVEKGEVSNNCDPDFPKNDYKNLFNDLPQNCLEKKLFACDTCSKTFKCKSILVRHIKYHNIVKSFSCALCEYKGKRNSDLVTHMRTHTGEKPFTCEICNKKFAFSGSVVAHMRTHTGEKPFTCKICSKKFRYKAHLVRHMRIHTGEKPFSCKICNAKFTQSSTLVSHVRTHTGEKPYICKVCNSKFGRSSDIVRHMRTHTGEKPFTCKICNAKFAQNSHLVSHVRTHTGEKPYICKICNSKFGGSSDLVNHMRTHTGEKPFSCTLCEYKCISSSDLVKHSRTHTGEKPFTCMLCDYKCSARSRLATHMRTHTGEKPFTCLLCEYRCSVKRTLVRHMRSHR